MLLLRPDSADEYARCMGIVRKHGKAAAAFWEALVQIKTDKLYLVDYPSWIAFCRGEGLEHWMSKKVGYTASKLMERQADNVVEEQVLGNLQSLPEAQQAEIVGQIGSQEATIPRIMRAARKVGISLAGAAPQGQQEAIVTGDDPGAPEVLTRPPEPLEPELSIDARLVEKIQAAQQDVRRLRTQIQHIYRQIVRYMDGSEFGAVFSVNDRQTAKDTFAALNALLHNRRPVECLCTTGTGDRLECWRCKAHGWITYQDWKQLSPAERQAYNDTPDDTVEAESQEAPPEPTPPADDDATLRFDGIPSRPPRIHTENGGHVGTADPSEQVASESGNLSTEQVQSPEPDLSSGPEGPRSPRSARPKAKRRIIMTLPEDPQ